MKSLVLWVGFSGLLLASSGAEDLTGLSAGQLNARGLAFFDQRQYRDAEKAYRASLEAWCRLGDRFAASRSITAGNLGTLLWMEGRYNEAEPLLLDRMRQTEAEGGMSPDAATAATTLAALYHAWGRFDQAEAFAIQAETALRSLPGHTEERLANRRMLASILLSEGRYQEGEPLMRGLLADLPPRLAVAAYNDLAAAEMWQQRPGEAEPLATRALELARQSLPPDHPLLAVALNNLAQAERFLGRYLEAERNYREAIDVWGRPPGPQRPDLAKGLMNLAAFYHERGRESGAEDLYRKAMPILERAYGRNNPLTLVAQNELGEVLRAEHRYSESERVSKSTLAALEAAIGQPDPRVIRALDNYARLLEDTRRAREATAVRGRIQSMAVSLEKLEEGTTGSASAGGGPENAARHGADRRPGVR
jgi:tetratricopeptide (TPR) repeat protein